MTVKFIRMSSILFNALELLIALNLIRWRSLLCDVKNSDDDDDFSGKEERCSIYPNFCSSKRTTQCHFNGYNFIVVLHETFYQAPRATKEIKVFKIVCWKNFLFKSKIIFRENAKGNERKKLFVFMSPSHSVSGST